MPKTVPEVNEMLHSYDELKSQETLYGIQEKDLKAMAIEVAVKSWLQRHTVEQLVAIGAGDPAMMGEIPNLMQTIKDHQASVEVELAGPKKVNADKIAELKALIEAEIPGIGETVKGFDGGLFECRFYNEKLDLIPEKCEGYLLAHGLDTEKLISNGLAKKVPAKGVIYPKASKK